MQSLYINSEKLNKEEKCGNERSCSSDEEEKKPRPKTQRGKTLRGAALNSNFNTELNSVKNNITDGSIGCGGIYANKINKTKQVGREIVKKINTEEGKLSLSF
jgi:hypothetical protein